jgi:hypothetical protein
VLEGYLFLHEKLSINMVFIGSAAIDGVFDWCYSKKYKACKQQGK